MFGKRSTKPNEPPSGKTAGGAAKTGAGNAVSLDIVEQPAEAAPVESAPQNVSSALPDEDTKYNDTKQKVF
jgi:hypothetical protein